MKTTSFAAAASTAASQVDQSFSWSARLRAFPVMLGNVLGLKRVKDRGVSRFRVGLALLGLLYVVSPIDFIPELLLGPFGLADDAAIAVVSLAYLLKTTDKWLETEPYSDAVPAPQAVWVERDTSPFPPARGEIVEGEIVK